MSPNAQDTTISIAVRDERGHEKVLHFKTPSREKWLASANRFLKPEPPSWRVIEVYERLLKTCAVSTGLSKRSLEQLPIPALEHLYQQLWAAAGELQKANQAEPSEAVPSRKALKKAATEAESLDQCLSFFLFVQELAEFRLEIIVREDVQVLGERGALTMHSYYPNKQEQLNGKELNTFLHGQDCPNKLHNIILNSNPASEELIHTAYWASRRLESSIGKLHWDSLFEGLSNEEGQRYPRLGRLKAISKTLQSLPSLDIETSESFLKAQESFQNLLNNETLKQIAQDYQQARPLRLLVLVEGETEIRLLPLLAEALGHNLDALGIHLLPSGGKNHMSSLYKTWAHVLKAPICVILDDDASSICQELEPDLRASDRLFRFTEGEFEDAYNLELIIKTINRVYEPFPELNKKTFLAITQAAHGNGRVAGLKTIWNQFQLGSFDKVVFAQHYAESLSEHDSQKFISPSIQKLFRLLLSLVVDS
jgi:hypothetical protein